MTSETGRKRAKVVAAAGVALALAYGVLAHFLFDRQPADAHPVLVGGFVAMSIAFLFVVPFALGAVTAFFAPRTSRYRWFGWVLLPIVPCALLMGIVLLLAWEGMICIALAAPIFLAMAMLGGVVMGVFIVRAERNDGGYGHSSIGAVALCVLLPFLMAPAEARVAVPESARVVETSVAIDADAAAVWSQIVRVPAIADSEQPGSLFHRIGIPRPLEATLSHEGVGGVRHARFDSGIEFEETVTEWTEGQGFAFDIRVDPGSIGSTLDRHVRVGGEYFDVLEGRFRIQPAERGVVLHLTSRHRLSTRFNGYAGLWTDAIMRDIHRTVCAVVKARSEALAAVRRASSRVD